MPVDPPAPAPDDLDLTAAADRLGVHYQTAYRWVRDGSLPAVRVRGRYRVAPAALDDFARRRDEPEPVATHVRTPRWERLASRFEAHLVGGDEAAARAQVLDLHGRGVPATEIISNLFVPALQAIGEGWVAGTVGIPEEHRASAIVERLLGELSPRPRGRRRGTAVVAAVSGEHHALPTSMAATALREDRWHVEHLGADLPPDEVVRFARASAPDLVVLSVTNPAHAEATDRTGRLLEDEGVPTIVGRPGHTLDDLRDRARALAPASRRARAARGSVPRAGAR